MTDTPLLDQETINSLQDIIEDGIFDIMSDYRDQTATFINDLDIAYKNNDIKNILHLAHTIKGSSGSLGLAKMLHLTQVLEEGLREDSNLDTSLLIYEISTTFNQTIDELILQKYLTQ